jgi:hypothetical protein
MPSTELAINEIVERREQTNARAGKLLRKVKPHLKPSASRITLIPKQFDPESESKVKFRGVYPRPRGTTQKTKPWQIADNPKITLSYAGQHVYL